MVSGRRDVKREALWRRAIREQACSGLGVRAWCRNHRVTESAFYWWRRELARRDVGRKPSARRNTETPAVSFVPVHVSDDPVRDGDPQIEIVLTDGRRVRITGPVDGQRLAEVLDVLERRAC